MIESRFDPISLAELNAKAEMLTRLDNKYVVPRAVFDALSDEFAEHFEVLEIDGKRGFGYRTQYFDTPQLTTFQHHLQGRRRRSKVRTRQYIDAGLCFLEVKLKTQRKVTVKERMSYAAEHLTTLTQNALSFIDTSHRALYRCGGHGAYFPAIQMQYNRLTLVARAGGERMTIDRGLTFWTSFSSQTISDEMMIVETKSAFGRGTADIILRRAGYHPVGSCSKYCVGLAALGLVPRYNRFLPAFKKLLPHLALPGAQPAPPGYSRLAA